MKKIVLTTLNSRFTHTSLALRYLYANMQELQENTCILEFTINEAIQSIAERLLDESPKIIGIGVYIWNAGEVKELIEILKKVTPQTKIILGGPEVSYEPFRVDFSLADVIIQGEGDLQFYSTCKSLLNGEQVTCKIIKPSLVELSEVKLPYEYYTQSDIKNRYIYVEASRGCPFSCEFCLSSIDEKVRNFDTYILLKEFKVLWSKGVRNFKFIDRTFNLNMKIANALLDFFLSKEPPYFAHFEVIPDHFPDSIKQKIALFPSGSLQLEIGIQTLDPQIALNISRPLKLEKIRENITFLQNETKTHMHLDLIVGLPGESIEGFGKNLNALCTLTSSEIQIGILKKLSGTVMNRHDENFGMLYSNTPPYDILKNNLLNYKEIQKMKRFARFWDLIYNSGNFKHTFKLIHLNTTVFDGFYALSEWIYTQTQSTWKISLDRLNELLFNYFVFTCKFDVQDVSDMMMKDILSVKGRAIPKVLKPYVKENLHVDSKNSSKMNKRQKMRGEEPTQ
ncbi:MAG: DUF4080 domain-containing protein [Campylobacterota bacterium]|nr:DUF4080 domain-containing protein [Campylobacterota bacterium]